MAVVLKNIDYSVGADNFGGTASLISWCPVADLLTIPAVTATPAAPEDKVLLAGTLTCKTGKKFWTFYITPETGSVKSESVGPRDAGGWKNTYEGSSPGSDKVLLGMLATMLNTPFIAYITELDGQVRQLGDVLVPATISKVDAGTGGKVEDGKFVKITIESVGRLAPILPSSITIPYTPAA